MHHQLPIGELKRGNYIDLLEQNDYYTTKPQKIKRQRINDNLLGFSHFCPFVRRTALLAADARQDLSDVAKKLLDDYAL